MQTNLENILGSGILRGVAAILAIALSSLGLYSKFAGSGPAIKPVEIRFETETGVVISDIERNGSLPKPVKKKEIVSLKMATKSAMLAWRINLRSDCFLIQRSVGMINDAGLNVSLGEFTGALDQGENKTAMFLIPVKVPSDIVPGAYTAYNDETYKCGETIMTYKYPKVKVNVRY